MAHTHSHREPAGGGSGQAKPREQSEAGGSYPHPRCEPRPAFRAALWVRWCAAGVGAGVQAPGTDARSSS